MKADTKGSMNPHLLFLRPHPLSAAADKSRSGRIYLVARHLVFWLAIGGGAVCAASEPAYPSKPVRLLVGFSPGGGTDVAARIITKKLAEMWGQQVVVDNRAGAGGLLAFEMMAKANPDGYTLLASSPSFAIQPGIAAQPAVRPDPRFRADHAGVRGALSARAVPGGRGEIGQGVDRASRRRIPASSTTHPAASAARSTWPPNCSASWPASTWCTFPSRAPSAFLT